MECRGRRGRRGRGQSSSNRNSLLSCSPSPNCSKPWTFLSSLYNFLILSSLIGIIYLMLDYHCNNCNSKSDLNSINKSIADIAKNLALMKNSYYDLEMKICRFSQDLPKIEGQIEILEAIAAAIECKDSGWDPRTNLALPNVDVVLNKQCCHDPGKNITSKCKCPKRLPKPIAVN